MCRDNVFSGKEDMMLCERCGKREATVNVVCVVNNTRVSKWLCESCAKEFATEGVLSGQNSFRRKLFGTGFAKPFADPLIVDYTNYIDRGFPFATPFT